MQWAVCLKGPPAWCSLNKIAQYLLMTFSNFSDMLIWIGITVFDVNFTIFVPEVPTHIRSALAVVMICETTSIKALHELLMTCFANVYECQLACMSCSWHKYVNLPITCKIFSHFVLASRCTKSLSSLPTNCELFPQLMTSNGLPWFCWAHFLSLPQSKLRLCAANHRAGYFSNLACDWLIIVWAYSEQETENGPWWISFNLYSVDKNIICSVPHCLKWGIFSWSF